MRGVGIAFSPRADAQSSLVPACAVGVAAVGRALARCALERGDRELLAMLGATTADTLFLLGPEEALPWVPGVQYLGRDPRAPLLLLPTELEVDVPLDVLQRAILGRRDAVPLSPPLALLAAPRRVVSLACARTVDRELLQRWWDTP